MPLSGSAEDMLSIVQQAFQYVAARDGQIVSFRGFHDTAAVLDAAAGGRRG